MQSLLYVTQVAPYRDGPAGVHGVLDQSETGLRELAGLAGLAARCTDDVSTLSAADLASARVLALFTIGETPWTDGQRAIILDAVRSGRMSVVAVHASTDSCHGWDEYGTLVGARFNGHPWTQEVTLDVIEPDHPALKHLGPTWRWYDEIYQFKNLRNDARVLLRVRPEELDMSTQGAVQPDFGFPFAWCFQEGAGRVFYTTLGHFQGAWENPTYMRHLYGGLTWALGEGE